MRRHLIFCVCSPPTISSFSPPAAPKASPLFWLPSYPPILPSSTPSSSVFPPPFPQLPVPEKRSGHFAQSRTTRPREVVWGVFSVVITRPVPSEFSSIGDIIGKGTRSYTRLAASPGSFASNIPRFGRLGNILQLPSNSKSDSETSETNLSRHFS